MAGIVYGSHRKPPLMPKLSDEVAEMIVLGGLIAFILTVALAVAVLISKGVLPMPGPS